MIRTLIGLLWDGPPDPMLDAEGQPLIKPPKVRYGVADWTAINRMGAKRWRETCEAQGKQRQRGTLLRMARER